MKFFKIYHQNCRVAKAYIELTKEQYEEEVGTFVSDNVPMIEDEDGAPDYGAMEIEMDSMAQEVEAQAKTDDGANLGDYSLYIREDDADKYDIARATR